MYLKPALLTADNNNDGGDDGDLHYVYSVVFVVFWFGFFCFWFLN